MKRVLIVATLCAFPVAASAAVAPAARLPSQPVMAAKAQPSAAMQVADYYKGKKHCYTRGSSTICN